MTEGWGLTPAEHIARARELADQHPRPGEALQLAQQRDILAGHHLLLAQLAREAKPVVELHEHPTCSRGFIVVLNDEEIAEVDYDAYGWGGLAAVERVVCSLAEAFGGTVEDER